MLLRRSFLKLPNALVRRRQVFRHGAAQLLDSFAHGRPDVVVGQIRLFSPLYLVSTEFFISLSRTKEIGCKLSTAHMVQDFLALL